MVRKIRVLFDANPLVKQKTGVGFYTEGLIKALSEIPELELSGHFFAGRGPVSELPKAKNLSYTSNSWLVGMLAKGLRKLGIRLPWELLARRRADVLLFPDFTTWPSLFGKPEIVVVHDLTYIDLPQFVRKRNLKYLQRYVKRDAQRAALVLTISEFTKRRLMEAFSLPAGKILVEPIPPAKTIAAKKISGLPKKFILFIGTIEPRKNLGNLLEAYALLPDDLKGEYALVIAGGSGWDSQETLARIKQFQTDKLNIVALGYVDPPTRSALYQQAAVVAVPSFYEGFGMPVLEAMSYKAPVIASSIDALKEVGGQAAMYFDPHSVDSIRNCLIKVLSDSNLRKKQVEQGTKRLKNYSWQSVAADIYKEIERLAG